MKFQITSAGFAAAFAASNQGPEIRIGQFRVGAGVGYTPAVTDTALRGALLHTGTPIGYRVLDPNTCEFTIRMDETVGTWQFGEIGLYLLDGTLFALGSLQRPQWKAAFPDRDFNRYNVRIRLVLNGVIPTIELVVQQITAGVIWELPSVDDLPLIEDAQTNVYLCHSQDENGNDALCTVGENRWTINTHLKRKLVGTITAVNATGTQFTSPAIILSDSTAGRYLVQFTSGAAKGLVRRVSSMNTNQVNWVAPEQNIAVGDTFEILQGSASADGGGGDDAFFYSLLGR
jgi:hypothetical protein